MSDDFEPGSPEAAPKPRKTRAKKATAGTEPAKPKKVARETKAKTTAKTAAKTAPKTKKSSETSAEKEETKTPAKKKAKAPAKKAPIKKVAAKKKAASKAATVKPSEPVEDPIGDVSDGEGRAYFGVGFETEAEAEIEAYRAEAEMEAVNGTLGPAGGAASAAEGLLIEEEPENDSELEPVAEERPPAHLERLQKILSQAGIASRRRAEEMIVAGRVMVNGQVVTALGSKADPERDHIRVDGKLLHGAERHRYFVLNKPRGYVTTVSDPEGRPTVMDFVAKLGERVYPVGRLDFQSEGLLLMTNDGELANRLTRASSGVEKTYLVKVAGQPSEEDLEKLRHGVVIDRGHPGKGRVRTAPARVRQVRRGENPWYEVVLTEGRNRELRKMFGAVGHFVEKIRRVAYGPLVLDLEPGKLRELSADEVALLRLTAEGKLKPRRVKTEAMLPKEAGRTVVARPGKPFARHGRHRDEAREFRPRGEKPFRPKEGSSRPFRSERPSQPERPHFESRPFRAERPAPQSRPRFDRPAPPGRPRSEREEGRFEERPRGGFRPRGERPGTGGFEKPKQFDRPRQFDRPKEWSDRRPDEGAGKAPGRGFGKGPGKGPGKGWDKRAGGRPFRKEGGGPGPGFRGKASAGENKGSGFPKSGFKGKRPAAGKFAGANKPGGGRHGSQRPFGKRSGGKRRG